VRSVPKTRYARSGDLSIAYQCFGEGPVDLVVVPGWISNVEWQWEEPGNAHFLRRLGSFARVVSFDKRGTGLSDRVREDELPGLDERMDDLRAVMDDAGTERAVLMGISEGGSLAVLFAATYPERTTGLLLCGSFARFTRTPDYPWVASSEDHEAAMANYAARWGEPIGMRTFCPTMAENESYRSWWASLLRQGASPGAALALYRMNLGIDVRPILPSVSVPTLVIHRKGDRLIPVENGRYLAEQISGARLAELEGDDHFLEVGDSEAVLTKIEQFVTGMESPTHAERVLTTVLFVDMVDSTRRAVAMGDRRWRALLESYHAVVRREIERHRGVELDAAGDGFLASFDGPTRAVRCALVVRDAVRRLGIDVRAGAHTGECERLANKLGGVAVHIGARIAGLAGAGEVLVSGTVRDLVTGSGIAFSDRGETDLRGVSGRWRLFSADA